MQKHSGFSALPAAAPLTLGHFNLCSASKRQRSQEKRFRETAARQRNQRPQLSKARRFGAARDSLFTLDSKRRFRLEAQFPFPISVCPTWFWLLLRPPATPPLPPSRNRRSLTSSPDATCSASPRPAPARLLPSCFRCSPFSKRAAPEHACRAP